MNVREDKPLECFDGQLVGHVAKVCLIGVVLSVVGMTNMANVEREFVNVEVIRMLPFWGFEVLT